MKSTSLVQAKFKKFDEQYLCSKEYQWNATQQSFLFIQYVYLLVKSTHMLSHPH